MEDKTVIIIFIVHAVLISIGKIIDIIGLVSHNDPCNDRFEELLNKQHKTVMQMQGRIFSGCMEVGTLIMIALILVYGY